MRSLLFNLKRIYSRNSILQFLISHILILILSLLIMGYGFGNAFKIVKSYTEDSYITMLQHSVHLIDNEMDKMKSLALRISKTESVSRFAEYQTRDKEYATTALKASDHVAQTMNFQKIELIENTYIFFRGMNLILYEGSYYRPEIMKKYLDVWGISEVEWFQTTLKKDSRVPYYHKSGGKLEYVFPFSNYIDGGNEGVIVFQLQEKALETNLDFLEQYEDKQYTIAVLDPAKHLLWSNRDIQDMDGVLEIAQNPDLYYVSDDMGMLWTRSKKNGWIYVLLVPQKQALEQLSILKKFVYSLFVLVACCGTFLSVISAVRKGKPLDELYTLVTSAENSEVPDRPLGETVSRLLKNHQELLKVMESEKPTRQKMFIHDLLKGEFGAAEQLLWEAEKSDIQLKGAAWLVANFELFTGNDFYDIELQTLEEVHIIAQVLHKYLTENYPGQILFCTSTYKSSMVIFEISEKYEATKERACQTIANSCKWLSSAYQVETRWGISHLSEDLMLLWKSAEEAKLSLGHCNNEHPIIEYSIELENIYDFYFPEIAQERLKDGICSGNMSEVESVLAVIKKENLSRRLARAKFLKLNRKITDLLSDVWNESSPENGKRKIMWLNELIINADPDQNEYFQRFFHVCQFACQQNSEMKKQQRGKMTDEIMQYLNEHYMDSSLGLAQVGILFHISEGYLSSIFKKQTGVNFADYLENIRIERAKELLLVGNITVSEIAGKVGYNSVHAFRRAFKRVEGISPKEVRKR